MSESDWYCQCQDYDEKKAKLISQKYSFRDRNHVVADVLFTVGGRAGSKLKLMFVREQAAWKLDDLRFEDGTMLRAGLQHDIANAAKVYP